MRLAIWQSSCQLLRSARSCRHSWRRQWRSFWESKQPAHLRKPPGALHLSFSFSFPAVTAVHPDEAVGGPRDSEADGAAVPQQHSGTRAAAAGSSSDAGSSSRGRRARRGSLGSNSSSSGGESDPPHIGSSYALEAGQAGGQLPRYSTHTCIGEKFYDNWHSATCKFDHMCLNASTLEWEYYIDPELPGGSCRWLRVCCSAHTGAPHAGCQSVHGLLPARQLATST